MNYEELTRNEIKAKLDEKGVEYVKNAHTSKLRALLAEQQPEPLVKKPKKKESVVTKVKKKLKKFTESRVKQYEVKFLTNVLRAGNKYNRGRVLVVNQELYDMFYVEYVKLDKEPLVEPWDIAGNEYKKELVEDLLDGVVEYKKGESYDIRDLKKDVVAKMKLA